MTTPATNPHSTWKNRKTIPVPPITFDLLDAYRANLQAEMPPGVTVSLHSALHHAVSIATNMRALPGDPANANLR
jgi:hypothetical protein